MSSPVTILLFFSLLLTTVTAPKPPTIFKLLDHLIVPEIQRSTYIKSSTLNPDTGVFKVKLGNTAEVSAHGLIFTCKPTIRGVMSKNMSSATELEGISAKIGVLWMDIMQISWTISEVFANETEQHSDVKLSMKAYPINYNKLQLDSFNGGLVKPANHCCKILGFAKEMMVKMKKKLLMIKWSL